MLKKLVKLLSGEKESANMRYKVRSGDSLSAIAVRELGDASKYMEIARINKLDNPDSIYPGQLLVIPVSASAKINASAVMNRVSGGADRKPGKKIVLSGSQLKKMMPEVKQRYVDQYIDAVNCCLVKYQISTPLRVAHFIAQIGHESASLQHSSENLNYSAKALRAVFGKYFSTRALAEKYARQPEKIASRVYANRMGNGDEASGDGWRYRGRGLIQLTGKKNYQQYADSVGVDLVGQPDLVADDPVLAVDAAGWYWDARGLNTYADKDDLKQVTRSINGGYHGFDDRQSRLKRARKVLGC